MWRRCCGISSTEVVNSNKSPRRMWRPRSSRVLRRTLTTHAHTYPQRSGLGTYLRYNRKHCRITGEYCIIRWSQPLGSVVQRRSTPTTKHTVRNSYTFPEHKITLTALSTPPKPLIRGSNWTYKNACCKCCVVVSWAVERQRPRGSPTLLGSSHWLSGQIARQRLPPRIPRRAPPPGPWPTLAQNLSGSGSYGETERTGTTASERRAASLKRRLPLYPLHTSHCLVYSPALKFHIVKIRIFAYRVCPLSRWRLCLRPETSTPVRRTALAQPLKCTLEFISLHICQAFWNIDTDAVVQVQY